MIYRKAGVWILAPWSLLNNGDQNSNFIFQKQNQDKAVLTENIKPFFNLNDVANNFPLLWI